MEVGAVEVVVVVELTGGTTDEVELTVTVERVVLGPPSRVGRTTKVTLMHSRLTSMTMGQGVS